jgi:hypothetical protein
MKKVKLVSTDGKGETLETDNPRYIQFAKDMTKAGMPWRIYRGTKNEPCAAPAVITTENMTEADIEAKTSVRGFEADTEGMEFIFYPVEK